MKAKKILFVATVDGHIKSFHIPYLRWFKENGYETHVASNGDLRLDFVDKKWQVDFERSPFSLKNVAAFRQLSKIIKENDFILVSCHTPMASVITRLVSIGARRKGMKLLYTAHGFHFFKGASVFNWLLYFPTEVFLTKLTDAVVTINEEDFQRIRKYGSKCCEYFKIPGIGVNSERFYPLSPNLKEISKRDFGFQTNKVILIYAAELSKRKNHQFIIEAMARNREVFNDTIVLFAGKGDQKSVLKNMVKEYLLDDLIFFLGFRTDVAKLFQAADIGISSSKQEGLPINTLEEMFAGLPVIVSDERGHRELICDGENGYLFSLDSYDEFVNKVNVLVNDPYHRKTIGLKAISSANKFELNICLEKMSFIFKKLLGD